MASSTVRLVTEPAGQGDGISIDVPAAGAGAVHLHLHIGTTRRPVETDSPPAIMGTAKIRRGPWRPILILAAGCAVAFVAFDLGARSDANQAYGTTPPMPSVPPTFLVPPPTPSPAVAPSGDLPAALRTQLAQPPSVTLPPGASQLPANAFGLHP